MANSVIGALRVSLGLDSAQFTAGLTKAQTGLAKFASIAKVGGLAIATSMITAGTAVGVAVKGMIDQADEMSKAAQKFGVPIEELSKLKYAAELSDVTLDQLGKGLIKLSVGMTTLAQDGASPAAKALQDLGIKATDADGRLRSSSDVFSDVAGKFAEMDDGARKTALAVGIFGKSGADLIPLLNSGKDGLKSMADEATALGIVFDEKTGKAAEAFNDNLTRLHTVGQGITTQLAAAMLPALQSFSEALVGAAKNTVAMKVVGEVLGGTLKVLVTVVAVLFEAFMELALGIGAAGKAAWAFLKGDFKGVGAAIEEGGQKIKQSNGNYSQFIKTLWSKPSGEPPATKALQGFKYEAESAGKVATKAAGEIERAQDRLTVAFKKIRETMDGDAQKVFDETRTPMEKYAAAVEHLQFLLDHTAMSQDTFNRRLAQLQDALPDDVKDPFGGIVDAAAGQREDQDKIDKEASALAAENHQNWFESTRDGIEDGLHAIADGNFLDFLRQKLKNKLFAGLADDLANLLDGRSGGGGIISGLKGLTKYIPGFATGGTILPGGTGGIDSQLIQFRKSPNERVDITKPGQSLGGGSGGEVIVHVDKSKYFDVHVQRIAATEGGRARAGAGMDARRGAVDVQTRLNLLGNPK